MKKIFVIDKLNRVYLFTSVSVIDPKIILCRSPRQKTGVNALFISEIKCIFSEKPKNRKVETQKKRLWKALGI